MVNKYIKLQRKLNLIESHYLAQLLRYEKAVSVRRYPSKTRVVNCFPSLSITWITSSLSICITQSRLSFFNCWQLSAIRRIFSPLNPYWKENISFTLTKTVPIVVLITRHYSYNCIKLISNSEVFYPHFSFCLIIFTTRQAMYISRNSEVHLYNHCCSRRAIVLHVPKVCVCSLRHPAWNDHTVICDLSKCTIFYTNIVAVEEQ